MTDSIEDIRYHIIKNLITIVSELENELEKLKLQKERLLIWQDHAGFSPNKVTRYRKLLEFVKDIKSKHQGVITHHDCISCKAEELLKEIGESE